MHARLLTINFSYEKNKLFTLSLVEINCFLYDSLSYTISEEKFTSSDCVENKFRLHVCSLTVSR